MTCEFRVIVTGGRDFKDGALVWDEFEALAAACVNNDEFHPPTIVHGGARGADRLCAEAAQEMGFLVDPHPADWDHCAPDCKPGHRRRAAWGEYCPTAGIRRNQEMVDAGADLLMVFPGGDGTEDCVRRARRAGIEVYRAGG